MEWVNKNKKKNNILSQTKSTLLLKNTHNLPGVWKFLKNELFEAETKRLQHQK
jgi:hypothetical protein